MSEAFAPEAARTAPAPDDREGLSERTVRIGTSIFGARLATAAAGARLPAAPALLIAAGRLLPETACRALDPRFTVAAGRLDFASTCRPLDPAFLSAVGWLLPVLAETACAGDAARPMTDDSGLAAARREVPVSADRRSGADDVVSAGRCCEVGSPGDSLRPASASRALRAGVQRTSGSSSGIR
jgi:hypothetical protein